MICWSLFLTNKKWKFAYLCHVTLVKNHVICIIFSYFSWNLHFNMHAVTRNWHIEAEYTSTQETFTYTTRKPHYGLNKSLKGRSRRACIIYHRLKKAFLRVDLIISASVFTLNWTSRSIVFTSREIAKCIQQILEKMHVRGIIHCKPEENEKRGGLVVDYVTVFKTCQFYEKTVKVQKNLKD